MSTTQDSLGTKGSRRSPGDKGRTRHLLVGTLGIVLRAYVTAASTGDRDGAAVLLGGIRTQFPG